MFLLNFHYVQEALYILNIEYIMSYSIYRNGNYTPFEQIFQSGSVYEPAYDGMMGFQLRGDRPIEYTNVQTGFLDKYDLDIGRLYKGAYIEFFTSVSNVNIPNGVTRIKVILSGAGGSGQGGRPNRSGNSGCSAAWMYFEYTPVLGQNGKYSIVIGTSPNGGAVSNNNSVQIPGETGGLSSFTDEGDVSLGISSRTNICYGGLGGGLSGDQTANPVLTFGENVGIYSGYQQNNGIDGSGFIVGADAVESAYKVEQFDTGTYYKFYPSSLPLWGKSGKGGNNTSDGFVGHNGYCRLYFDF